MKHLKVYKIYEANEQPVENKSDSQGRSERLTTQAQKEYKEGPELQKKVAEVGGTIAFSSLKPIENQMSKIQTLGRIKKVDLSKYDLRGATVEKAYKIKVK